jgi:hypothetical protein
MFAIPGALALLSSARPLGTCCQHSQKSLYSDFIYYCIYCIKIHYITKGHAANILISHFIVPLYSKYNRALAFENFCHQAKDTVQMV